MIRSYIVIYSYYFFICTGIFFLVMIGKDEKVKRFGDRGPGKSEKSPAIRGSVRHLNALCYRIGSFFVGAFNRGKSSVYGDPKILREKMNPGCTIETFTGYKLLSSGLFVLFGICAGHGVISSLLLGTAGGILGFVLPLLILKRVRLERARKVDEDLPYIIDLLSIAVLAGQNIYGAFKLLNAKYKGAASRELSGFNRDIDLGMGKEGAYRNLANKKISRDFSDLILILTQSGQYGSSVNEILKQKSRQIRFKNLELVEAKIRKMSVVILFPLVFLILPSFILLVGSPLVFTIGGNLFS